MALDGAPLVPVVHSEQPSVRTLSRHRLNFFQERFRRRWYRYHETIREDIVAPDSSASVQHDSASDFPMVSVPVSEK